jgi:hypothetical protein
MQIGRIEIALKKVNERSNEIKEIENRKNNQQV